MTKPTDDNKAGPGTRAVNAGRRAEWTGGVVNPPVWRASTHLYPDMAALRAGPARNEDGRFFYGRRGGPTQWALAEALTEFEPQAAGTMLYPSGVAAIAGALLAVLRPGDEVLVCDNAYEPTRAMATGLLANLGVTHRFFDPSDPAQFGAAIGDRTRAVMLECPGSLTLEVCDIPALTAVARRRGVISVIDNTWAGPTGFAALAHGADITVMSLTKHVGGHSDLMMGSASAGADLYARLRHTAQALGQVVSPDDAALALRGLRTLPLRLDHTARSALAIARHLDGRGDVARVLCPMLPGSPGHALWRRDFAGGCGLFSFVLKGGDRERRDGVIDALARFGIGYSWGGFESLVSPVDPAGLRSASPWPLSGMDAADRFAIRLSIGLEDTADLIADLDRALDASPG